MAESCAVVNAVLFTEVQPNHLGWLLQYKNELLLRTEGTLYKG